MARKIIVLERQNLPSDQDYRVAFWLDVPATRRAFYANATAASVVLAAPVVLAVLAVLAVRVVPVVPVVRAS